MRRWEMRTLFWVKVSFFGAMVVAFWLLNLWPVGMLMFGSLLGFLANRILNKMGYEVRKVSLSLKWIILFGALVWIWYYIPQSAASFSLIQWLIRLLIVCFFFEPEISVWKRKNIHDNI